MTSTPEETLDCPLNVLGLIVPVGGSEGKEKRYRFNMRPKPTLPPTVFAYALLEFWDTRHPGQATLSLREVVHGEASPGRVFRLDEDATLTYLDALSGITDGRLAFADTALVRQVARYDNFTMDRHGLACRVLSVVVGSC